jgi:PAS domain S-box-containing protein
MAPSTGLAFIILSGTLGFYVFWPAHPWSRFLACGGALLVFLGCLFILGQFIAGSAFDVEHWLYHIPGTLGAAALARMSPLTAGNFLLAAGALLGLWAPLSLRGRVYKIAGGLALGAASVGLIVVFGYMYETPLLYGDTTIPVALTTGLAFIFLGLGVIAALGPDYWPLRPFGGATVRARLLRVFLPFTVAVVLTHDLFEVFVHRQIRLNPALVSAWALVLSALIIIVIVTRIAQVLGGAIDRAESERKQAEKTVQESEEKLRTILENTQDVIARFDHQCRYLYVNTAVGRYLSLKPEDFLGKTHQELGFPEKRFRFWDETIREVFETGQPQELEFELDGLHGPLIFNWRLVPEFDEKGKVKSVVTASREITPQKQMLEALQESEARYKRLVGSVTDYIYTVKVKDGQRVATSHGPGCIAVTGYSPEEYEAEPLLWYRMVHEEYRTAVQELAARAMRGETPPPLEHRIYHQDGSIRWVRNTVVPRLDEEGKLIAYDGLIIDITERKNLETQLFQSQRMEAVGTLAGGIAHDFNNLLTAMMGNLELTRFNLERSRPVEPYLEEIEKVAARAAELTSRLLAFSRRQIIQPVPLNLNDTVNGMNKMLSRLLGEHIQLDLRLTSNLAKVKADPGQMEQVIMNLCINARDAMPQGGKLTLATKNLCLETDYINHHPWVEKGDYILLEVADTGIGMDKATQERIFEPFFTTKEVGKGTGLGLSMVFGIIKQHQGYINVYSEPGQGTVFKIYLPRTEKEAAVQKVKETTVEIEGGKETILLAEDEENLRDAIQRILEMFGYTVLVTRDGQEAVELYQQEKERIDLVILDAVMPRMGGMEAADYIYKLNPHQKILFSSGYSVEGIHEKFVIPPHMHFIQKPYNAKALAQKVREVLESK